MANFKKVSIILVNYMGWRDTIECLESVLKLDYPDFQVIVVDNESPNDSMSKLLDWAQGHELATCNNPHLSHLTIPPVKKPIQHVSYDKATALKGGFSNQEKLLGSPVIFIKAGENRGFAAGCNIGTEYVMAKQDSHYIWYLNNDTVVEKNALSEYVRKSESYSNENIKVGIIGAKLMYYDEPLYIQGIGGKYNKWFATSMEIGANEKDNGQYDNDLYSKMISYPIGASMLANVSFIKDVGMMCEDYFLYFEELDWMQRGIINGWQIGYCFNTKIFHKQGASIGSSSNPRLRSNLSDYHALKNKIFFTKKFYKKYLLFVRFSFLIVIINRLRRGRFIQMYNALKIMLIK